MLRLVFILLLLANGAYYAWSHGALRGAGLGPSSQSEPGRLAEQVHPERLVLLASPPPSGAASDAPGAADGGARQAAVSPAPASAPAPASLAPGASASGTPSVARPGQQTAPPAPVEEASASKASAAPASPTAPSQSRASGSPETAAGGANATASASAPQAAATRCLEAGPFAEAEATVVRQRAAALLPAGAWSMVPATMSGRWMVYMGRYPDAQTLEKKRAELRARQVDFAQPGDAALQPGLSLGVFSSEQAAETALANLGKAHGIRTARVVQLRGPQSAVSLRLPAVGAALKPALEELAPALAGHTLTKCE